MLEYEWGSSGGDDDPTPTLQPYAAPSEHPQTLPCFYGAHFHPDNDPRAFPGASYPPPHPVHPSMMMSSLEMDSAAASFMMIPKPEPGAFCHPGLNLGLATGRTYFSAADDDFVSRLYRRSGGGGPAGNAPRCQAEGCNADLTHAKHYHRRHKVCDFHSKAPTVVAAGITQRFCQQCSRFHLLTEFDNGKRSCRRRLADHNRRRRKSNQPQPTSQDRRPSQNTPTSSSDNPPRSPADPVTVANSPGRMEESRPCSYNSSSAASSSVSTPPSTTMYY